MRRRCWGTPTLVCVRCHALALVSPGTEANKHSASVVLADPLILDVRVLAVRRSLLILRAGIGMVVVGAGDVAGLALLRRTVDIILPRLLLGRHTQRLLVLRLWRLLHLHISRRLKHPPPMGCNLTQLRDAMRLWCVRAAHTSSEWCPTHAQHACAVR